ncbi:MAG: GNAT family N-acetyltransferase [Deltaproteobacteria bacterium]|nr:GNAT family N-acetyltransferase [Deltaproteobacteria bacterium]
MPSYATQPLTPATWPDFARLVEKHKGVWGGCWCMAFHAEGIRSGKNRSLKEKRVREGRAHAALVYAGDDCVGWCQFGPTEELPNIKHKRAYADGLTQLPDWRITCFFVDRERRRAGVAAAALRGALQEIARLGGGKVESYPEDISGRSIWSFLHNGSVAMFEKQGFHRDRRIGKNNWVVQKTVRKKAASTR